MTDQKLADKVVALGVGIRSMTCVAEGDPSLYLLDKPTPIGFAGKFVRDWRVAGACLERWPTTINVEHLDMTLDEMLRDPRTIIEAFVEAPS